MTTSFPPGQTVTLNGMQMYYVLAGQGEPLVLLHGYTGSSKDWADAAYRGKELADWCKHQGAGWDLEVVERTRGVRGFSIQPHRWVVERCFAWLTRNRRRAWDYERKVPPCETLIEVAVIRLLVARLGRRRAGSAHLLL
jgi:transposase